jgi:hypothetical protein
VFTAGGLPFRCWNSLVQVGRYSNSISAVVMVWTSRSPHQLAKCQRIGSYLTRLLGEVPAGALLPSEEGLDE